MGTSSESGNASGEDDIVAGVVSGQKGNALDRRSNRAFTLRSVINFAP